jgi:hypothetical protein
MEPIGFAILAVERIRDWFFVPDVLCQVVHVVVGSVAELHLQPWAIDHGNVNIARRNVDTEVFSLYGHAAAFLGAPVCIVAIALLTVVGFFCRISHCCTCLWWPLAMDLEIVVLKVSIRYHATEEDKIRGESAPVELHTVRLPLGH